MSDEKLNVYRISLERRERRLSGAKLRFLKLLGNGYILKFFMLLGDRINK